MMNNSVVRKILFLTMALSIMQQFTGINNVLVFSVKSFSQQLEVKYARVFLSGLASLFAFISIFFIDCKPHSGYKRLTLLKVGALGMLGCNLVILAIWNSYMEVWYLSIAFLFFFEASVGSVMWLYISELTSPVNMGISTACNWAGVLMISLISYYDDDTFRRVIWGLYCADCFMV